MNISNEQLLQRIVAAQLSAIRLQKLYKDNPLAIPALPSGERKRQDAEWQEALRRGLGDEINREIKTRVEANTEASARAEMRR